MQHSEHSGLVWWFPHSKVHGANMGPTWALSAQMGPMLVPWTLLSGFISCKRGPVWTRRKVNQMYNIHLNKFKSFFACWVIIRFPYMLGWCASIYRLRTPPLPTPGKIQEHLDIQVYVYICVLSAFVNNKGNKSDVKRWNTLVCLDQYTTPHSKHTGPPNPIPTPNPKTVFFQWHTQIVPPWNSHTVKSLWQMAVPWIGSLPPKAFPKQMGVNLKARSYAEEKSISLNILKTWVWYRFWK